MANFLEKLEPEISILDLIKQQRVCIVELDTPRHLETHLFTSAAKKCKEAGADIISIADNSLGILRISNFAAAMVIRDQAELPTILHLSCRDKNRLALQAELMGYHALGSRHILAITGDTPKHGDHPEAKGVYDFTSSTLIQCAKKMNSGHKQNDEELRLHTNFVVAGAFNPNAANFDNEVAKFKGKIEKGVDYAMTQPVYDQDLIKKTFATFNTLGLPVFIGLMPILNPENAVFVNENIPGIHIPEKIISDFQKIGHENKEGIKEYNKELLHNLTELVSQYSNGIYYITPFMRREFITPHVRFFKTIDKL
jgi:homocysteine S-methyltransferase